MNSNITAAAILTAFRLAGAHSHHWAHPVTPGLLRAGRARRDAAQKGEPLPDCSNLDSDESEGRAPLTAEEADAMGWLPTAIGHGITFSLSHRTGSGRLGWQIDPTGTAVLTIYRPGDRVVACAIVRDGHVTVDLVRPHEIETRHAEALAAAINVACGEDDLVRAHEIMHEMYQQCPARLRADAMAACALRAA